MIKKLLLAVAITFSLNLFLGASFWEAGGALSGAGEARGAGELGAPTKWGLEAAGEARGAGGAGEAGGAIPHG